MGDISDYEKAKEIQSYLSVGGRESVQLNPLNGSGEVGVSLNLRDPQYHRNTWENFDVALARVICADIFDKLGPAVQALFNRLLAERVEKRRQEAIEWAMKKKSCASQEWSMKLASLGAIADPGEAEGEVCARNRCDGVIEWEPVEDCSCHIVAPCGECENRSLYCPKCGWTAKEDE